MELQKEKIDSFDRIPKLRPLKLNRVSDSFCCSKCASFHRQVFVFCFFPIKLSLNLRRCLKPFGPQLEPFPADFDERRDRVSVRVIKTQTAKV